MKSLRSVFMGLALALGAGCGTGPTQPEAQPSTASVHNDEILTDWEVAADSSAAARDGGHGYGSGN
jgi:hypothetical protein